MKIQYRWLTVPTYGGGASNQAETLLVVLDNTNKHLPFILLMDGWVIHLHVGTNNLGSSISYEKTTPISCLQIETA